MNRLLSSICLALCLVVHVCEGQPISLKVNSNSGFLELRNGKTGIVIPWQNAVSQKKYNLAPVQSLIYSDGSYSDNTVNLLRSVSAPVSFAPSIVKNNAGEIVVKLEYRFRKEKYEYGNMVFRNSGAGPGFYTCTISIRKDEPVILIEEDADYDIEYTFKISNGLRPDKARYRGWQSSSVKDGYEPDGTVYRSEDSRGYPMDATVDLDYSKAIRYPTLSLWDPAGGEINTGRYWQLFNSAGNDQSPLLGFFHGRPSRLVGAHHVGPALELTPEEKETGEKKIASIVVSISRRAPDNVWHSRKRFEWGIFLSTKKDLLDPKQTQPIGIALNRKAGIAGKIESYSTRPGKFVPAFYAAAIYMPAEQVSKLREAIRKDDRTYQAVCSIESGYKALWDAWKFRDSANSLLAQLKQTGNSLREQYTTGEGVYKNNVRYWKGVLNFKYYALCAAGLLSDKTFNLSGSDKKELEQLVLLMARILWDDNNVPFFDSAGVNFGPSNMAFQYRNTGRDFFALLLADDPEFSARAKQVPELLKKDIAAAIAPNGASFGSPHYTQATIDPILFTALQLKQAGVTDVFRSSNVFESFARFYLNLLTPPSVRFNGNRKLVSFGDGSEESASTFALLATAMRETNKELSSALYSAYFNGPPRFSYAGPVPLAADFSLTGRQDLPLGSGNFDGYYSVFRSAANTNSESALWILNGERLADHRNDDAGEVAIYALGAPLSVSRSSFYSPLATDARIRAVMLPEALFPEWKGEQPIAARSLTNRSWPESRLLSFANFGYASVAKVLMRSEKNSWVRTVMQYSVDESYPVFAFYDSLASGAGIWSLPMLCDVRIQTPAGLTTAEKRIYNGQQQEIPKAGKEQTLAAGWNRFSMMGQPWPLHPSGGIDWQLYTFSAQKASFTTSQWTNTWQNSIEQQEFQTANKRNYTEEQVYLRIRSATPVMAVLLPFNKGASPYGSFDTNNAAASLAFTQGEASVGISPSGFRYQHKNGNSYLVLSAPNGVLQQNGFVLSGGTSSVKYDRRAVEVRVHGAAGKRTIVMPFAKMEASEPNKAVSVRQEGKNTVVVIDYKGSDSDLLPGEKGYSVFTFYIK